MSKEAWEKFLYGQGEPHALTLDDLKRAMRAIQEHRSPPDAIIGWRCPICGAATHPAFPHACIGGADE